MRGRPPSIRDEDLLDAARDEFREEGHGATTAAIARRAGVSEGILFYRFQSREALLAEVIHRETQPPEALREITRTAAQRGVAENLQRVVDTLLASVMRAHPFLELAETSPTSGEIRRVLFARSRRPPPQRIVELVAAWVQEETRLGRVRALDPVPIARAIFGGCVDFVRSRHFAGGDGDAGAFARGLVDVLLHGAAKPARPRRAR
jgi:AcrR family transcriptional regulator